MAESIRILGASSSKLLGYLVGLGLLRVVARQADADARACWRDGALELHSALDQEALEAFLLDRWSPAPVVSPWNGGSGFFAGDNTAGFEAIEADDAGRLALFRTVIAEARTTLARAGLTATPEPKVAKPALLRALRATLPDAAVEWLDATMVLVGEGTAFPPLLGSGGNDGRYDIANNYAQSVAFALALGAGERGRRESWNALRAMLWRQPGAMRKMSLGHFVRDASPVNSPAGNSDALGNPWDLALAVEGTLLLAAGAGRRLADGASPGLIAPFTMRSTGAGYGSAAAGEKGRAELWLPLWRALAALPEIEMLFREARAQVGRRAARSGLDAARAAGELGVARGIDAFERFSILERAGQSNLAVHAGRVDVRARPAVRALSTLDPWLGRVVSYGAGDIPRAQRRAIAQLERSAFAVAEQGTAGSVAELLVALGRAEAVFAVAEERSRPDWLRPIAPAAGPWLDALGTDRIEVRLAVGLGSVCDRRPTKPGERRLPSLRDYLHGTAHDDQGRRSYGAPAPGRVPALAGAIDRVASAHERRHMDAARDGREALGYSWGIGVGFDDLARLVDGSLDERTLGGLVDGFALLDYTGVPATAVRETAVVTDPLLGLLMLAFHDSRRGDPGGEPLEPCRPRIGWVTRLRAGRVRAVTEEALLRLRLAGLPPVATLDDLQTARGDGPRIAAALLAHPVATDVRQIAASATLRSKILERQETTP